MLHKFRCLRSEGYDVREDHIMVGNDVIIRSKGRQRPQSIVTN